ncbi:MAG: hypothetical protein ACRD9L_27005 [Bryobacteraceae bacterium]
MSVKMWVAVFLLGLPLAAQQPLPGLRIEPAGGGSIFYVRNDASQPLTAYLVELVDYPGSHYALWQDDITDPIPPRVEKRIPVASMLVGAVPNYVKVRAAIYADGTWAGIPEKIAELVERRRVTLKTTRELIARLTAAQAKEAPKPAVNDALRRWADSMTATWQATARTLIVETAARLESESLPDALARLRTAEQAIAGSKPAL